MARINGGRETLTETETRWPYLHTVWGVAADFLFAILPWIAFRSLNMGKRQKYTIAGSLSLGVM